MEGSGVWVLSYPVRALLRATALTSLPRQMGAQHPVSLLLQFRGPGYSPDSDPPSLNTLLSSSRPGSPPLGCPAILICTRMCEGVSLYLAYVHPLHSAPLTRRPPFCQCTTVSAVLYVRGPCVQTCFWTLLHEVVAGLALTASCITYYGPIRNFG